MSKLAPLYIASHASGMGLSGASALNATVQFIARPRWASLSGALRWAGKYASGPAPTAARLQAIGSRRFGRATAHGFLASFSDPLEEVFGSKFAIREALTKIMNEDGWPFEGMRARFQFERAALPTALQEPAALEEPACRLVNSVAHDVSDKHLDSLTLGHLIGRSHQGSRSEFEVLVLPMAIRWKSPEIPGRPSAKWVSGFEMLAYWASSAASLIPDWIRSHAG